MHNLISYNQLASWNHLEKTIDQFTEEGELMNDYFNCLIECDDKQQECKRICKLILSQQITGHPLGALFNTYILDMVGVYKCLL